MATQTIRAADRDIPVSKLDKPFYPDDKITKGDVIEHYQAVADVILPHLARRPLALRRYPDGIDAEGFVQQDASGQSVDWLRLVDLPRRAGTGAVSHVVCDDPATLVYLANQAAIELHNCLSTVDSPDRPDRLVIDIDPPEGVEGATLRAVARPPGAVGRARQADRTAGPALAWWVILQIRRWLGQLTSRLVQSGHKRPQISYQSVECRVPVRRAQHRRGMGGR